MGLLEKIFGDLNDKQAEYIKDIQISSLHLLGMINEILDISKLEANAMKFTPTELNTNQTIQEVINILIEKGVLVRFQGSAREFVIDDYDALYRMLRTPEDYSGEK